MSKIKGGNTKSPFYALWQQSETTPAGGETPAIFPATVSDATTGREIEGFKGIDSIQVSEIAGLEPVLGSKPKSFNANPLNPYFKCIPMPGEQVMVMKGAGDRYYYSSIINYRGQLGDNIPPKGAAWLPDATDFFFGLFGKPRPTKKMDPTEGDVMLEGRAGQSIRFTSTSEESFLKKLFGGKSENKPVMMITCHNDEEEGLGNEDILTDNNSIYLCSETPLKTLKLESNIDKSYQKVDDYEGNQIVVRSDRLILSSKRDQIILSSADKVGISTKKWKVDIDKLMDVVERLSKELTALTKAQATFSTGVGPTGAATNSVLTAKISQDIKKLKQ